MAGRVRNPWAVLAAVLLGTFTGAINNSIANIAVLDVLDRFDLAVSAGAWFIVGYIVAFAVLMPVAGRLAHRFGTRRVYIAGMALFVVASAAVALSASYPLVIAGRVLQGVGAAPILPVVMVVIARVFPPGVRGRAMGLWAAANGAALALGPAVGGLVSEAWGWRSIFWLDVPLALGALLLAAIALPADDAAGERRTDVAGALLLCGGLVLIMLAFSTPLAGAREAVVQTVGAVFGVGLLVWFWRRSHRLSQHVEPIVGVAVLRDRTFVALTAIGGLQMMLLAMVLLTTPLMLSSSFARGISVVGVLTFLMPISMVVFGPVSGYCSDRIGPRRLAMTGSLLLIPATALLAVGAAGRTLPVVIVGLITAGVGVAAIQTPVAVSVTEQVDDTHRGAAMGVFHSMRFAGAAVGTSISAAFVELIAGGDLHASGVVIQLERAFAGSYIAASGIAVALLAITYRMPSREGEPGRFRLSTEAMRRDRCDKRVRVETSR